MRLPLGQMESLSVCVFAKGMKAARSERETPVFGETMFRVESNSYGYAVLCSQPVEDLSSTCGRTWPGASDADVSDV